MSGIARKPRGVLTVNGETIACTEIEVTLSKAHKSDSFHASVGFNGLPKSKDVNWWSTANNIAVVITLDGTKVFDGKVDHVDHDFDGQTLSFSGRDKSGQMIDKPSTERFLNKKPHEIVQDIAARHGIPTNIDQVPLKAGKMYQIDHVNLTHRESEWTAIQRLAERHGMTAYMTGGTLYFKNENESLPSLNISYSPPTSAGYATGNFMTLKAKRNCMLGRPLKCKVSSWNHKEKKANETEIIEPGVGDPVEFRYNEPGLSKAQTAHQAKKHLDKNASHELTFEITIPGDATVTPRMKLVLSGTGTAYDQEHEILNVSHHISFDGGFRTSISPKSKSKKRGGSSSGSSSSGQSTKTTKEAGTGTLGSNVG